MGEQLATILYQLVQINTAITQLSEQIGAYTTDLSEFAERFEEVMERLENERRLDLIDYD